MAINYKNLLQEWCQQNAVQLPTYKSTMTGEVHNPSWNAGVKLEFNDKIYYTICTFKTKIDAEQHAAMIAYKDIKTTLETTKQYLPISQTTSNNLPTDLPIHLTNLLTHVEITEKYQAVNNPEYIVLLDLENIQPSKSQFDKPNTNYYAYISTYSTVKTPYLDLCDLIVINSPQSDAADHLMTWHASRLAQKYPNSKFIVVSRDKFSALLVQLMTEDGISVTHIRNLSEYTKWYLDKL